MQTQTELSVSHRIAKVVAAGGGRALIVGGYVRDLVLGLPAERDIDLEIYGLTLEQLQPMLAQFGEVETVGRAFGVLKLKGLHLDISLPRRDSRTGRGHRGFDVATDIALSVADAARRRDLTMNSMALDPLTGEVLDPFNGRTDLADRVLRATDPAAFSEDPLRALRVAQFAARFEMRPDAILLDLLGHQDLSELPAERIWWELHKFLLKGVRPSLGLTTLREGHLLRYFPELDALIGCPQDPLWHPEGDVFTHTLLAIDAAGSLRTGDEPHDLALMLGILCHDFGKPLTTATDGPRIRSRGHEVAGNAPTRAFLKRIGAPPTLVEMVVLLVQHHLAPVHYRTASDAAYRRLARTLGTHGVTLDLLHTVARADHLGGTTADAVTRHFPDGDRFLERSRALHVQLAAPTDVVLGRHLIVRGLTPGPSFGPILAQCRAVQLDTGLTDPETILTLVLNLHHSAHRRGP